MENLWPEDIVDIKLTAPIAILKKQASLLGEKTKNIVEAEIEKISDEYWIQDKGFAYSFYIVGQVISYKFNLFQFGHGVAMYPLSIKLDADVLEEIKNDCKVGDYGAVIVESEGDFLETLKKIFNSTKTRRIVQAIIAQSDET